MFYDKNNIFLGIALGLAIPFVGYALFLFLVENFGFRVRTVAMMAICLNIIPVQLYQKKRYVDTIRGVVIATVICAVAWIVTYYKELF